MDTLQATEIARNAIEAITGQKPEMLTKCENLNDYWSVDVVIVETKAKLQDNDILAKYEIKIDNVGAVLGYERTTRYTRSSFL